jgi:cell division septum initiation protein DivIVA
MKFHISWFGYDIDEVDEYVERMNSDNLKMREENQKLYSELQQERESLEDVQARLIVNQQILKAYTKSAAKENQSG